jgi:hypothetical protein
VTAVGAGRERRANNFRGGIFGRRPRHLRWLVGGAGRADADPIAGIMSAFEWLESAAAVRSFRGCPYVDAALAAPANGDARAGAVAWRHKEDLMPDAQRAGG